MFKGRDVRSHSFVKESVFVKFSVNNSLTFSVAELTSSNSEPDGKVTTELKSEPLKLILV